MSINNIKVSIVCLAYNHEPYIRETLDSFIDQETNFEYEIIVHDDASTDDTAMIIQEYKDNYSNKIVPVFQKSNQYSRGIPIVTSIILPLVKGKYIAFCEGDDSWSDNKKLQKQYDFLEKHPECSAVAGVTRFFDDAGIECMNPIPSNKYCNKMSVEAEYLSFSRANIGTNTIMARVDTIYKQHYVQANLECSRVGDILLILQLFEAGNIFIMPDCFQKHIIQTREEASNYNSIFGWEEKFMHCIQVVNAVTKNYKLQHNLDGWFYPKLIRFYIEAIKNDSLRQFNEIYEMVCKKYKKHIIFIFIKYIPKMLVNKFGI